MARRVRVFAVIAGLALILTACDWPMFRYGPDRSGFSPDTSISKDAVATRMVLRWTGATGAPVDSSPAMANGVVYVGSDGGNLYAFGAAETSSFSGNPKLCPPLWTGVTDRSDCMRQGNPAKVARRGTR